MNILLLLLKSVSGQSTEILEGLGSGSFLYESPEKGFEINLKFLKIKKFSKTRMWRTRPDWRSHQACQKGLRELYRRIDFRRKRPLRTKRTFPGYSNNQRIHGQVLLWQNQRTRFQKFSSIYSPEKKAKTWKASKYETNAEGVPQCVAVIEEP